MSSRSHRSHPSRRSDDADLFDQSSFQGTSAQKQADRKQKQLCRQVERSLSLALAGECGDPILQDLMIESVTPAPDATCLLVTVICSRKDIDNITIYQRLGAVHGLLRRSVAAAIVRKRAPELSFLVIRAGEVMS